MLCLWMGYTRADERIQECMRTRVSPRWLNIWCIARGALLKKYICCSLIRLRVHQDTTPPCEDVGGQSSSQDARPRLLHALNTNLASCRKVAMSGKLVGKDFKHCLFSSSIRSSSPNSTLTTTTTARHPHPPTTPAVLHQGSRLQQ